MSYIALDRCDGPECPHCGCTDAEILQAPAPPGPGERRWWAGGRARCRHCGQRFAFDEVQNADPSPPAPRPSPPAPRSSPLAPRPSPLSAPIPRPIQHQEPPITAADSDAAVLYCPVKCPACGSTDVRVTSTKRPVRRHKCRKCGQAFKSVER